MTRKLSRKTSVLRGIAPFIAVLTVMIALAALAPTRGAGQASGKSHAAPVRGSAVPSNAGPLDPGTPLFLPAVAYEASGFFTQWVAVGDLNGDGKPDLLVGNACINPVCLVGTVDVLLGAGDGNFRVVGSYGTTGEDAAVAIADVNGDGKPDMLAAGCNFEDCFTGVVTVRTGNGDGTFAGGSNVFGTGGMFPSSPAVADFNGDGKLDLVVANCGNGCQTGTGTVGVLLGNGDATFQTAVTYGTGGVGAHSVVVADVNGDGKPDLVVANACASSNNCPLGPGSVGVLLGNGDGTFQTAVAYGSGGNDAFSVAVADVNGDGKLDVLVANFCGNTDCSLAGPLGVMLGNGDGTFQPVIAYSLGAALGQIALADVNGDGKLDIATTSGSTNAMVLLGNGDGTFQAPVFYGTGGFGARGIAIADVNGDGRPDLMVTNLCFNTNPNCPHGSVGVLLNNSGPHSPTTTSLVSNVNPAAINQLVIYTATVTNQSGGPLAGTVAFKHNRSTTTVPLVGGQAIYKVSYSGSGTHLITATYSGDADNATSTSATLIEYVGLAPTKTILTTSGSPSFTGQPVTFTATVTWINGTVPDGELVTFFDGTTAIGTGGTTSGTAKFTTSSLTVGTHTIKVTYPGDATFKPSSGTVKQVVNKYPTTTTLTSSLNPSHFGQAVTFTARVTGTGPAPAGNVRFLDGTTGIGLATLSGGVAELTESFLAPGPHSITAQYQGDAVSAESTSPVVNQDITPRPTTTVVSTSGSPSLVGQPVTFTAMVTSTLGAIPNGELVTFYDGTTAIGTNLTKNGVAAFTTSSLTARAHTIKATYAGDVHFSPSSGSVTQVVEKYTTTTTLTSSLNPSQFGQAVTFTAHVTSSGPTPTGTVKFLDGTIGIGQVTLSGGIAELTKSNLAVGTHPITAHYNGDAASSTSTSAVVNQVVQ